METPSLSWLDMDCKECIFGYLDYVLFLSLELQYSTYFNKEPGKWCES